MAGLPDIPSDAWDAYQAQQFQNTVQPRINALTQPQDPRIEAIRQQVDPEYRHFVDDAVASANKYGLDPLIYTRQVFQESGFNPRAGSNEGAKGINQFTDPTAKGFGIDPWDAHQSLDAGARYDRQLLDANNGDWRLALASYNAGGGNVAKYGERIFDPQYLLSQGWSQQDAYQPKTYIDRILGSNAGAPAPAALPQVQVTRNGVPDVPSFNLGTSLQQTATSVTDAVKDIPFEQYANSLMNTLGTSSTPPKLPTRLPSTNPNDPSGSLGFGPSDYETVTPPSTPTPAPDFGTYAKGLIDSLDQVGTSPDRLLPYNDMAGAQSGPDQPKPFNVGDVPGAIAHELQRPRQLVDLGIPTPGMPSGTPGEKLATYYGRTDTSQPANVRLGQALDLSQQSQDQMFSQFAPNDPTGGILTGAGQAGVHLMDPTIMVAPEIGAGATVGTGLGAAAGAGYSRYTGATPEQTAANVEGGANLGMLAGGGIEGVGHLAQHIAPYVPGAIDAVGRGLTTLGQEGERLGLVPGAHITPVPPAPQPTPPPNLMSMAAVNELIAPARNAAPVVQDALRNFANRLLQAPVDAETHALQAKRALGADDTLAAASSFERTGQVAASPTLEQQLLAAKTENLMLRTGALGRQHGYIRGDVTQIAGGPTNYFPHVYQNDVGAALAGSRKGLSPRDFYSNDRAHLTLDEALAAGANPVDSFSGPLQHYAEQVAISEAKYQLVQDLKNARTPSAKDYQPGDKLPAGWVPGESIDKQFAPKPSSALDANGQPITVYSNGTAFSAPVATALKNILGSSPFRETAIGRAALDTMGAAKESLFSLSGFHLLTELRQSYRANGVDGIPAIGKAMRAALSPRAYEDFRLKNADAYSEASRAGVTGLSSGVGPDLGGRVGSMKNVSAQATRAISGGLSTSASVYGMAKTAGDDEGSARQKALIGGVIGAAAGPTIGKVLSDSLWERAVPTLKVLSYQIARQGGRVAPEAAATFVNQTFGGNNLAAIARSPMVQDIVRVAALAPDWWEGWARQLGGIANRGQIGGLSRAYWARTAAVDGALLLEGLNYAINGHLSTQNDPGHQFDLELTGLYDHLGWPHVDAKGVSYRVYVDTLGPIKAMISAPGDPGHFIKGHMGMVPSAATDAISNRDFRGQPIADPSAPWPIGAAQQAGHALARIAPVGAQGVDQTVRGAEPLPVSIASTVAGLRTSHGGNNYEILPSVLPSSTIDLLQKEGVTIGAGPVGRTVNGIPLSTAERSRYQQLATQYSDVAVRGVVKSAEWAGYSVKQRNQATDNAIRAARQRAANEVIQTIPQSEIDQRRAAARK